MKPNLGPAAFGLLAAFVSAMVLADGPVVALDESGEYVCTVVVRGSSSKDYVDLDTPSIIAGHMALVFDRGRLYLVSGGGYGDADDERLAMLDDMGGGKVAYQFEGAEVNDLVLPLTWVPDSRFIHVPHDDDGDDQAAPNAAMFDITQTALGRFLLQQADNPPTLTLKHSALIDHGYRIKAASLRFRVENVTTTFTFLHYKDAMAYCERANDHGDDGLFHWLD